MRERASPNLDTEIRFHLAKDLHRLVDDLLTGAPAEENAQSAARLEQAGYHLRLTRDLETRRGST
jgi:hypothetical protein